MKTCPGATQVACKRLHIGSLELERKSTHSSRPSACGDDPSKLSPIGDKWAAKIPQLGYKIASFTENGQVSDIGIFRNFEPEIYTIWILTVSQIGI